MTKKGPLGKAEIFYIKSHYKTSDANEIAKDLGRAVTSVKKQIELIKEKEPHKLTVGEQMAKRDGVMLMTENASQLSDTNRKVPDNKKRSCITKIKDV